MRIVDDKIAIEVPQKTQIKGIYIPQEHKTIGLVEGTVIKIGPGRYYPDGQRRPPNVKVGDRVVINNIAALHLNYEKDGEKKDVWVCKEPEIVMVLEEGEHADEFLENVSDQANGMSRTGIFGI